jgi:hypothetical protein
MQFGLVVSIRRHYGSSCYAINEPYELGVSLATMAMQATEYNYKKQLIEELMIIRQIADMSSFCSMTVDT